MKSVMLVLVVGIVVSGVLVLGCLGEPPDGAPPNLQPERLQLGTWHLDRYDDGSGTLVPVLEGTTITATFGDDEQLSGTAGCNNYFAAYRVEGDSIAIGPSGSTVMYCPEPEGVMDQESAYLGLLESAKRYQIATGELTLLDSEGNSILVFSRELPAMPGLTGREWRLVSYNDGTGRLIPVLAGTEITATVSGDNQISGSAGCNRYFSSLSTTGKIMNIGPIGVTRMYCAEPEGIMDQEAAYLTLLESVVSYSADDELVLYDSTGEEILRYESAG